MRLVQLGLRTFNFGGFKNNLMYHPEIKAESRHEQRRIQKSNGTTINHFYEKLLLLKDLMKHRNSKKNRIRKTRFYVAISR